MHFHAFAIMTLWHAARWMHIAGHSCRSMPLRLMGIWSCILHMFVRKRGVGSVPTRLKSSATSQ